MKRRNQIVHTLLTGVLIGGVATASFEGAALNVAAAEDVVSNEAAGSSETEGEGSDDSEGEGDPASDSSSSETEGSGSEEGGDQTDPEVTPEPTPEIEEPAEPEVTPEPTPEIEEPAEPEVTPEPEEVEESFGQVRVAPQKEQASARIEEGEEEDTGAALAEAVDDLTADGEEIEPSDGKDEAKKDGTAALSEAEILDAARKAAESKLAEEKDAMGLPGNYGFAYSDRAYYSGSYFVTEAQKRLALNVGFKKVDKVYGKPKTGVTINIREEKSLDARIVGELSKDGICCILENDDADWFFVESGEVRGFVHKSVLGSGEVVDQYVADKGEETLETANSLVDPLENKAFRHSLKTTKELNSILNALGEATVNRQAMIAFSMQFLGNPYVWGGDSLTHGCDCSGFTQQVYAQFGMSLPRCSYEQAEVGVKIPAEEALPGDLLFYARDGAVYHVLMYIGDGKAINASSSTTGIIISNVNYNKVCWACRFIADTASAFGVEEGADTAVSYGGMQAADLQEIGRMAYNGDTAAQEQIIEALAKAAEPEYGSYGFARSVIIAQAIRESGWCSFQSSGAGIQATDNNVLGMNEDLNNSTWTSPWSGNAAVRLVPQNRDGVDVYDFESMRLYEDIESCMEDYAAFKIGIHPELRGETDVDKVIAVGLKGYATDPAYQQAIRDMIDKYDLTRFDGAGEDTPAADDGAEASEAGDAAAEAAAVPETPETAEAAPADENPADSAAAEEPEEPELTDEEISEEAAENADAEEAPAEEAPAEETPAEETPADEADAAPEVQTDEETASEEPSDDEAAGEAPAEETSDEEATDEEVADEEPSGADAEEEQAVEDTASSDAADEDEPEDVLLETASDTEEAGEEVAADAEVGVEVVEGVEEADEIITTVMPDAPSPFQSTPDSTEYGQDQLELIWAIVAEEDDTSYDGALAVISTAMNRADANFGGYGGNALAQLTAEGQYRYSKSVDAAGHYKKRLNGNVPQFVKDAVNDCLEMGLRNTDCNAFAEAGADGAVEIGANWYTNQ